MRLINCINPQREHHIKADATSVTLEASVEKVIYFNDEDGQCILEIRPINRNKNVLLSTRIHSVYPGQLISTNKYKHSGDLVDNIIADEISIDNPNSVRLLKKFLKSEAFAGVKSKLASLLAESHPNDLFVLLENNPEELLNINGIGKKSLNLIIDSWREYKYKTTLQKILIQENLPLFWGKTIWSQYYYNSIEMLEKQPYQLAEKFNLAFDEIDSFALKRGFLINSNERISCALLDTLQNYCKQQGHCAYPENKLLQETAKRINLSEEQIENIYELCILRDKLISDKIGDTTCTYVKEIWLTEKAVAKNLLSFIKRPTPWGYVNLSKTIPWAQNILNIKLAPLQIEAIKTALSSSFSVITGGPGTGKTTLIRSLITILHTQSIRFALCSPTGKASQRLTEATGLPAQTIHRMLRYDNARSTFLLNHLNPLSVDLLLIDEASMIDLSLMFSLLDALPKHCALILIGDADQIPSVGYGSVLQSIINSKRFSTVKLTEIFRQKERSFIKLNAHRINQGLMPIVASDPESDFHYLPVVGTEQIKPLIFDLITQVIPLQYGIKNQNQVQILVPLNKGPLGTQELNEEIQNHFYRQTLPLDRESKTSLNGFGHNYRIGDKVMVIQNDYRKEVFNGDIGFIADINPAHQFLSVQFDNRQIHFNFDELEKLTLAYAISIHKSQGSEYKAVIVVISSKHLPMIQRNLIYTAITRGVEHVFLVADPNALYLAVSSVENNKRWQKLTELLLN